MRLWERRPAQRWVKWSAHSNWLTETALEVMSRFAANPKWLIYLPPTMSPSETSKEPGLLEHPALNKLYHSNRLPYEKAVQMENIYSAGANSNIKEHLTEALLV